MITTNWIMDVVLPSGIIIITIGMIGKLISKVLAKGD